MKEIEDIFKEIKHDFRCRLKEDCPAYDSKECLVCEHYCISYIDLYQIISKLEDSKR